MFNWESINIVRDFTVSRDHNNSFLPSIQLLTGSGQVQILQQEEEGAFGIQVLPRPWGSLCLALDPSTQQQAKVDGSKGRVDGAARVGMMWPHEHLHKGGFAACRLSSQQHWVSL